MSNETLEARVARLEEQMNLFLHRFSGAVQPAPDAWQDTVGMFRGDPIVREMIDESQRLREEDRGDLPCQ